MRESSRVTSWDRDLEQEKTIAINPLPLCWYCGHLTECQVRASPLRAATTFVNRRDELLA